MATLNFVSLLLIVCCIASTIETHSVPPADTLLAGDREAKNLLFVPFRPILPHAYGPESRYGYGSRQTNSPINPSIAQNGLGPFFGYFPNLLTQPCPACAECATTEMPAPIVEPVTCPSFEKITKECPAKPFTNVVGSNGTFELDIPATPDTTVQCLLTFISIYNDNKIEFKCSDIPAQTNMLFYTNGMTPAPTNGRLVQDTLYTSPAGEVDLSINNFLDNKKNLKLACTWKSIKP